MNKEQYLKNRQNYLKTQKVYKDRCYSCWQPVETCICKLSVPFNPKIKFVILTHPVEASKRIATGRLAHVCLQNSIFIRGYNFIHHPTVNKLINDDNNQCFVLYPGRQSHNLTSLNLNKKKDIFKFDRITTVFVIDGTWGNANKMLRLSPNLATLPKICFTPKNKSQFKVRKQPKDLCLSSLEAIHEIIELLGETRGFDLSLKIQDTLLTVFKFIVDDQLKKIEQYKKNHNGSLNPRTSLTKKRKRESS